MTKLLISSSLSQKTKMCIHCNLKCRSLLHYVRTQSQPRVIALHAIRLLPKGAKNWGQRVKVVDSREKPRLLRLNTISLSCCCSRSTSRSVRSVRNISNLYLSAVMNAYCRDCHRKYSPNTCQTCGQQMPIKSRYACKYQEFGCKVTSSAIDYCDHDKNCQYKSYKCPKVFGDCHWSGSVQQLIQHLTHSHGVVIKKDNRCAPIWQMELLIDNNKNFWPFIIHYDNHYFMMCCQKRGRSQDFIFKFFAIFIGQQSDAMKYKYKYEIVNQSNGNQLVFEGMPNSIRDEWAMTDSDGLVFDLSLAKRFNNNDFKISLKKIA